MNFISPISVVIYNVWFDSFDSISFVVAVNFWNSQLIVTSRLQRRERGWRLFSDSRDYAQELDFLSTRRHSLRCLRTTHSKALILSSSGTSSALLFWVTYGTVVQQEEERRKGCRDEQQCMCCCWV